MTQNPKLKKEQLKKILPPLNALNSMFGGDDNFTGLMICFLADAIEKYAKDEDRNMRKIKITFNDFFSFEYDLTNQEYKVSEEGKLEV